MSFSGAEPKEIGSTPNIESVVHMSEDKGFQYFGGFIPGSILSYCITPILCSLLLIYKEKPAFSAGMVSGVGVVFIALGCFLGIFTVVALQVLCGVFITIGLIMYIVAIVKFKKSVGSVVPPSNFDESFFHYLIAFISTLLQGVSFFFLINLIGSKMDPASSYNFVPYIFPLFGLLNMIFCTNSFAMLGVVGAIGALWVGSGGYTILFFLAFIPEVQVYGDYLFRTPGIMIGLGAATMLITALLSVSKGKSL